MLVAILLEEPDSKGLVARVHEAERPVTSVVNAFEATLLAGRALRNYKEASQMIPEMLATIGIDMIGIEADAFPDIVDAYLRYGKGTGHPAKLNFGDCFSYAMAKRSGQKLLYQGNDFAQTDLA